jgi:hypothetical protein
MLDIPAPGSPEAKTQRCLCPVLENCRGRGLVNSSSDDPEFYIDPSCPLHGYLATAVSCRAGVKGKVLSAALRLRT